MRKKQSKQKESNLLRALFSPLHDEFFVETSPNPPRFERACVSFKTKRRNLLRPLSVREQTFSIVALLLEEKLRPSPIVIPGRLSPRSNCILTAHGCCENC